MLFTAIPLIVFIIVLLILFINTNRQYNNILTNLSIASSFNADFQTTLDFKMYQVVINRDMFDELRPMDDIYDAQMVVSRLQETSTDIESLRRLTDIERYINFLINNISMIVENQGYEQNMQILDKRIRVLTMLVYQKMQEYIYNETRLMTEMRDSANRDFTVIVIIFSGLFVVITVAITTIGLHMTKRLTEPLDELSINFKTVGEGDFSIHQINAASTEVRVLYEAFRTMVAEIEELMEQIAKDKDNLRRIEFQLLQSQINPHFLYNTFDAIIWLTEDGEYEKVKQMMNSLSSFCRIALSDGKDIITIEEEIRHVQSYLEIQQLRYFDVLSYEIDAPKSVYNYMIPKLSLQPIVENALYHGIKHKRGGGEIKIKLWRDNSHIIISIRDTGVGMKPEKLNQVKNSISTIASNRQGYGLVNVYDRLRLHFHEDVTCKITSVFKEYTEVILTIPVNPPTKEVYMKRFITIIILLLFILSFFGCGNSDKKNYDDDEIPPGVLVVGYVQVGAESAWRLANTESFMYAFANSPRFDFRFVDSQNNPALQQAAVYDFIAQEVDYIIIAPIEEYGWDEILLEARDAGIKVIISDRMIETTDESLYVFWVGADFLQEGIDAMDWLHNYLVTIGRDNELLNVFHMQGTMGSSAQIGRTEGINRGIYENENLILKERETGDFTLERGAEVMSEWLSKFRSDDIDILIAENDDMAFGAIRAIEEAGLRPGQDIIIISFDAGRNAVQAVADGLINATIESNPLHGPRVRENIEQVEAGVTPQKRQYVHTGEIFDAKNATAEVDNRW